MRISDWSSDVCSSDLYALEVSGDSMVEAGILDGDYALVRRTDVERDGEIVVALIDDEEATLKYFRREGSMIRLDPANRNHEPQRYSPMGISIQGKIDGQLSRYWGWRTMRRCARGGQS